MRPEIASHLDSIGALCRAYEVRSLWLFGSAAGEGFDSARSDVDFLVDFGSADLGPWMTRFFEFQDRLSSLLGRPADLVLARAVGNPYVAASIAATKVPLYAAA